MANISRLNFSDFSNVVDLFLGQTMGKALGNNRRNVNEDS